MGAHAFEQCHLAHCVLVAALGEAGQAGDALLHRLQIGQREFRVDDFNIGSRVDSVGHVDDIGVFEAAHHVRDGICFADVGQELIAQPFTLGGARHQAGDIDELHGGGDYSLGLHDG